MMSNTLLFLTAVFITVGVPVQSFFNNPFTAVVKNERNKILSNVANDVRRMQIKNPFSSMLLGGQPMLNRGKLGVKGNSFNWTSCGPANQLMEIKKLILKPSPVSIPGTLTFSFDIVFHDNILPSDKITAAVTLDFQGGSSPWIKIPCIGSIGSCTYEDLCSLLSGVSCPPTFKEQKVPCHCPFNKGEYKLNSYSVEIDAQVFIDGDYKATLNLTSTAKGPVGCYKIHFSVE